MKKICLIFCFLFMILFIPLGVYAHPGRTDSSGCHTCRTNCSKYGLSYGQYHCHNSGFSNNSSSNTVKNVYGCTDYNSINYNSNANIDDGSCIKKVPGCMNENAYNYNPNANVDNGSCIDKVFGCIDKSANNYNSNANTADGSCQYKKIEKKYQKIKHKTKEVNKLLKKSGVVIQKGKNGKREIIKEIIIDESNNIVEEKVVSKKVIKKPIEKIIVR